MNRIIITNIMNRGMGSENYLANNLQRLEKVHDSHTRSPDILLKDELCWRVTDPPVAPDEQHTNLTHSAVSLSDDTSISPLPTFLSLPCQYSSDFDFSFFVSPHQHSSRSAFCILPSAISLCVSLVHIPLTLSSPSLLSPFNSLLTAASSGEETPPQIIRKRELLDGLIGGRSKWTSDTFSLYGG